MEGYTSTLNAAWSNAAENQMMEQGISKAYAGKLFQQQWNYGIAALGQAALQLPGSNAPAPLTCQSLV